MRIASLLCMGIACLLSGCSTVSPFPPNVPEGGRAISIAVRPAEGLPLRLRIATTCELPYPDPNRNRSNSV
jgi:hypothetical protein